jgi:hypothetical protein
MCEFQAENLAEIGAEPPDLSRTHLAGFAVPAENSCSRSAVMITGTMGADSFHLLFASGEY